MSNYLDYNNEDKPYTPKQDPRRVDVVNKIKELVDHKPTCVEDEQVDASDLEKKLSADLKSYAKVSDIPTEVKNTLSSTTDPAWTSEQQKNACDRLGTRYEGEWVLKGTMTADNASSFPIDLTGCTELIMVGRICVTDSCGLYFYGDASYSYALIKDFKNIPNIEKKGVTFRVRFSDVLFGFESVFGKYALNSSFSNKTFMNLDMNTSAIIYSHTNTSISSIKNIFASDTSVITDIEVQFYAR